MTVDLVVYRGSPFFQTNFPVLLFPCFGFTLDEFVWMVSMVTGVSISYCYLSVCLSEWDEENGSANVTLSSLYRFWR